MALIKCPECGKDVSDTVQNCIHCGYVLKQKETDVVTTSLQDNVVATSTSSNIKKQPDEGKNKKGCGKIIFIILAVLFGVFVIVMVVTLISATNDIAKEQEEYAKEAEVLNYHLILADYEANSISAEEKYGGKRYKGIGTVEHIFDDKVGVFVPCVCGDSHYAGVNLESEEEKDKVIELKKGDIIEFEATKSRQYTAEFDYGVITIKE